MRENLIRRALILTIITLFYNFAEGVVSLLFGISDDTLALLGFGIDSFVEIISALGILHMIIRMRKTSVDSHDTFEKNALKVTGFAFYILAFGLTASSIVNVYYESKPETTIVGIIVSSISILTMWFLMRAKLKVGKELGSSAIIADANCTKTCFYLSFILLISSILYEVVNVGWIDVLGSIGIAWFAFKEGREAFQKARNNSYSCSCEGNCH